MHRASGVSYSEPTLCNRKIKLNLFAQSVGRKPTSLNCIRLLFFLPSYLPISLSLLLERRLGTGRLGRWSSLLLAQGKLTKVANQEPGLPTELCRMRCSREDALPIVRDQWIWAMLHRTLISNPHTTPSFDCLVSRESCHQVVP